MIQWVQPQNVGHHRCEWLPFSGICSSLEATVQETTTVWFLISNPNKGHGLFAVYIYTDSFLSAWSPITHDPYHDRTTVVLCKSIVGHYLFSSPFILLFRYVTPFHRLLIIFFTHIHYFYSSFKFLSYFFPSCNPFPAPSFFKIILNHYYSLYTRTVVFILSILPSFFYNTVHHSHSPFVMELKVEQFAHRHDVALSGKSYGCECKYECELMYIQQQQQQ